MSQRELARRIWDKESRRRTIIAWEQGDNEPEPENLDRVAIALGIPRRRFPDRETRDTLAMRRMERLIRDEIERQLLPMKRGDGRPERTHDPSEPVCSGRAPAAASKERSSLGAKSFA